MELQQIFDQESQIEIDLEQKGSAALFYFPQRKRLQNTEFISGTQTRYFHPYNCEITLNQTAVTKPFYILILFCKLF